jgi:hypothetical protein
MKQEQPIVRMVKPMPTLGVLGVYTGIVLKEHGASEIREVMDHFYPGIMTIGVAMMGQTARREILRQHPELAELPKCTSANCEQYAADALARFGETILMLGPHGSGQPDMEGK